MGLPLCALPEEWIDEMMEIVTIISKQQKTIQLFWRRDVLFDLFEILKFPLPLEHLDCLLDLLAFLDECSTDVFGNLSTATC